MKNNIITFFVFGLIISCSSKKKDTIDGPVGFEEVDVSQTDDTLIYPSNPVGQASSANGQRVVELKNINFGFDSFDLSGSMKAMLAANAQWLKANPGSSIVIEGHCDERGTTEYNLALGERRASIVKDYLVLQLGVPANRVNTISYGEERPVNNASTDQAWEQNRRVEFTYQ